MNNIWRQMAKGVLDIVLVIVILVGGMLITNATSEFHGSRLLEDCGSGFPFTYRNSLEEFYSEGVVDPYMGPNFASCSLNPKGFTANVLVYSLLLGGVAWATIRYYEKS